MRWLACLLLLIALPAHAQTFPAPNGTHVIDAANVIPDDQEKVIDAKLKALEDSTQRQFVVATIADMQGYDLATYGYQLGRYWKIGQKDTNEGLILFLAPNNPPGQRGPRIEVGYGLEPVMTDALSSIIINTQMMPLLRNGDIPGAINAGVDAIIPQLTLPPEEASKRAQQATQARGEQVDIGAVIFWLFFFFFFLLPLIRGIFGKRGRRHGSGPVILWGPGDWGGGSSGGSSWSSGGGSDWGGGGGFSGGGGSFGGGGASGSW